MVKKNGWQSFVEKVRPGLEKTKVIMKKIGHILKEIGEWAYRLRSVLMTVPVIVAALILAVMNQTSLPDMVGINLLANGEYSQMIARETAVVVPVALTGACLACMLFSKRVLYPWLISIFSLALPIMIYITNVFMA